jgi:DNA-binding YbaB/EbfC family protein
MPGPPPNLQQLMKQAQKMQQQVAAAQEQLAATEVQGSAAGGLVTATVSGTGDMLGISLKPEAVDPEDVETLADLVVAAVRDAQANATKLAETTMGPLTAGLPPGLGF